METDINIVFLHHSTGSYIWNGINRTILVKIADRVSPWLFEFITGGPRVPSLMRQYNEKNHTRYSFTEMEFPKKSPYGWNNYPYDYYNIWVKNGGPTPYMEEPTLEMLTQQYQVIVFKHCYPSSNIVENQDSADIHSEIKTLANYKLQYNALKRKMHEFPNTKFIVSTGAVQVKYYLPQDQALRAKEFHNWVINEWNEQGDNIFIWDLYELQTEGELYFKDEWALTPYNSHPGGKFSEKASQLFFNRVLDIVEHNGENTALTGQGLK
ncbi:hypothetical protein [Saccharicrinis fermentans]|nr:hypothetical protein [Saccharicrinis fermentans]